VVLVDSFSFFAPVASSCETMPGRLTRADDVRLLEARSSVDDGNPEESG
jgi:hypothetical protein